MESTTNNTNIKANVGILLTLYLQIMLLKVIPTEDGCRCFYYLNPQCVLYQSVREKSDGHLQYTEGKQ